MVPSTGTTPICSDCNVGWIRIRNPALGLAMNFLKEKTKMPCTFYFLNQKFDSDSIWIRFELDSNYILPKPVHRMVWMIFLVSTLLMRRSNTMRRISNFHFVRFRHFTAIWGVKKYVKNMKTFEGFCWNIYIKHKPLISEECICNSMNDISIYHQGFRNNK